MGSSYAEAMESALSPVAPYPSAQGLIVKLVRLRNDTHPGMEGGGALPLRVIGHSSLDESGWRKWLMGHAMAHYGAGYTERMLRDGVDLREMWDTAPLGRQIRDRGSMEILSRAQNVVTAIEKWPSLYNLVAEELSGKEMSLGDWISRFTSLPCPFELGRGAYTTLGDLITGQGPVLPDF